MMKIGAVILAGGKSRRMGRDKSQLKIENMSFLDKIAGELKGFDELLVSVDDPTRRPEILLPMVGDEFPDCGPMCGIYSALSACSSDALVVVPCDTPLFSHAAAEYLCALLSDEFDAAVFKTADGRIHPLCGVYKKSCASAFEKHLKARDNRLLNAMEDLRIFYADAGDFEGCLANINTAKDYEALKSALEGSRNDAAKE